MPGRSKMLIKMLTNIYITSFFLPVLCLHLLTIINKNMANLTEEVITKLRNNSKARRRLSYEFDAHSVTIDRWIDTEENGEETNLSTPMGVRAIAEELEMKKTDVLNN